MLMNRILVALLLLYCSGTQAQDTPQAHYSFDDCDLVDETVLNGDATSSGAIVCDCGVSGSSLVLDGNTTISFPAEAKDWLTSDYSISFYYQSYNAEAFVDLVSVRTLCDQDSVLSIRYLNTSNEVELLLAFNSQNRLQLRGAVKPNLCWHQVTVVKSGLNVNLYVDNELAATSPLPIGVPYSRVTPLTISGSACVGISDARLNGLIDEFKIYDDALSFTEVRELYQYPDQIINVDTTIFGGAGVELFTGATCADAISWSPSMGLDDPTSPAPTASPTETTTYVLTSSDSRCTSMDSITINIIDSSQLICNQLLLPSAFTPNNDKINDTYGISNRFIIEDMESFEIRDRWGAIIFRTEDKNEQWDGRINGEAPNPGTYLYTVQYTCGGESYVAVDNFILMR